MKIGILTFHRALNYGAVLQCYALSETLKAMGHYVEVIDYRPSYIEKYRRLFYTKEFRKKRAFMKLRYLVGCLLMYPGRIRSAKAFDEFLNSAFIFSCRIKKQSDIPLYYDAILFGSDQIWNPRISERMDPVYIGQWKRNPKTLFITYAPSVGSVKNLKADYLKQLCENLHNFYALSVREEQLNRKLSSYTTKPISTVVDPVFLLPEKIYRNLAIKPQEEKYVLLYALEPTPDAIQLAERIAKEKKCEVIRLQALPSLYRHHGYNTVSSLSPQSFLGYFMYATFVVAVSFHGTAFSIIFKRDFYTIHSNNEDRVSNLLLLLNLHQRLVLPSHVRNIENIDYRGIDEDIEELRMESIEFINNSLRDDH